MQNAGHIPGTGQITPDYPTTSYSSTIEDCSNRCNALPNCCSFEYSAYNYLCYMNILCQPTQSAYIDFSFCTKEPGMFKNYQIYSLNLDMWQYFSPEASESLVLNMTFDTYNLMIVLRCSTFL